MPPQKLKSVPPPQNLNAEMCVLACQMLVGGDGDTSFGWHSIPRELHRLGEILTIDDYSSPTHKLIQQAIWSCREKHGGNCDITLVSEELICMGRLASVGGEMYLSSLLDTVPYSKHVLFYADIVVKRSRRRQIIDIGQKLVRYAKDDKIDFQRLVDAATKALSRIADVSEQEVADYSI